MSNAEASITDVAEFMTAFLEGEASNAAVMIQLRLAQLAKLRSLGSLVKAPEAFGMWLRRTLRLNESVDELIAAGIAIPDSDALKLVILAVSAELQVGVLGAGDE